MDEFECGAEVSERTADLLAYEQYLTMKGDRTAASSLTSLVCRWVRAARKCLTENEESHLAILDVVKDLSEQTGRLDHQINDEVAGLGWHVGVLERVINDETIGVLAVQDTQERRLDNLTEWAEGVNRHLEIIDRHVDPDVPCDAEERQIRPGLHDFITTNVDTAGPPLTREKILYDVERIGDVNMVHLITNCMPQDLIVNGSGRRFRLVPLHDDAA